MRLPWLHRRPIAIAEAPPSSAGQPPFIRELVVVTARSQEIEVADEWIEAVVAGCGGLQSPNEIIDYIETEFLILEPQKVDQQLARARREVERLRSLKRRAVKRSLGLVEARA